VDGRHHLDWFSELAARDAPLSGEAKALGEGRIRDHGVPQFKSVALSLGWQRTGEARIRQNSAL